MLESILPYIRDHWLIFVAVLVSAYLLSNYFNHGLHKYPGPFLARLTDWWRFWDVYQRRPDITHLSLHRKHGDIVRLGPNTLSFANPRALKQIYGLNKGMVKVRGLNSGTIERLTKVVWLLSCADGHEQWQAAAIALLDD